jgi:hypothetical protein
MVKGGSAADVDVQVDHGGVVRRQVDGEVSERLVSTSTGTVSSPSYTLRRRWLPARFPTQRPSRRRFADGESASNRATAP